MLDEPSFEEARKSFEESQAFDVDAFVFPPGVPMELQEELRRDFKLRQKLQRKAMEMAEQLHGGETHTLEDLQRALNQVALEEDGSEYGVPLPSRYAMDRQMVLAHNVPLHHAPPACRTELEEEISRKVKVRNSWSQLGDMEVVVLDTDEGPMAVPRYHAGWRLQKMIDTTVLRAGTSQTADAELRAMDSLKKRLNGAQWDSYVLSGMFLEESKRSGLHYFFRKGYPTIATSYRPGTKKGYSEGRVIACLCLHPMGYYQGSYCGLMCPTDEVICQLLMMRADERRYWGKCGQWSPSDPRSGI